MSLIRHSAMNLAGSGVPLLAAIPAMAVLARELGLERFGLVSLAWALVGYAGVLELGMSRAVVREIAIDPADRARHGIVLSSTVALVCVLGVAAAAAIFTGSDALVGRWLSMDEPLASDAVAGFRIVALSVPMLLPTLVLQGYWEGLQDFAESNLQRAIGGSLVPALTAAGAAFTQTFAGAMTGLLLARALVLTMALARGSVVRQLGTSKIGLEMLRRLLRFGGWLTLTNAVSPLMSYLDRYILGYLRGPGTVGVYAAPAEVALKLLVVPVAVTRGLFPKLVSSREQGNDVRDSTRLIAATSVPIAILISVFAEPLLTAWLGAQFAGEGALVLQILMVGFVLSSLAQVPFTRLQAIGRPEVAAYLHVAQVLPFLWIAIEFCSRWGAPGAAMAWSLRNGIDLLLLSVASRRFPTLAS